MIDLASGISLAVVLALWLVASVLAQLRPVVLVSRIYDMNGLLPNYRFFAPIPIAFDYILDYRCADESHFLSHWTPVVHRPKTFVSGVWNPAQRQKRSVVDLTSQLSRCRHCGPAHACYAYLALLNVVTGLSLRRGDATSAVQFRIRRSAGYDHEADRIIYTSRVHRVEGR
jgi:hypothetical protein